MEIHSDRQADLATLVLVGSLDATWSEAVERAVDEHVRQGARQVTLNCARVLFASSAGLGSLLKIRRTLRALGGTLRVHAPSEALIRILAMAKIDSLFGTTVATSPQPNLSPVPIATPSPPSVWREEEHGGALFQVRSLGQHVYRLTRYAPLCGSLPTVPAQITTSAHSLVLGVGSLGHDQQATERTGELVAIGGMIATLPAGGARADYLDDLDRSIAPLTLANGAVIEGQPSLHARFESTDRAVGLTSLLEWVVATLGGPVACVLSAEIDGVIGMAARLPPGSQEFSQSLHDPLRARQAVLWFGEPVFAGDSLHSVVVAMPVDEPSVTRTPSTASRLASFMRPMGPAIMAHAHAAVTSFRAIRLDDPDPASVVATCTRESVLRTVLHLVCDERSQPAIETKVRRGVIWAAPLEEVFH